MIEDYGIRMLTYGNAGGGVFYGPYRSFLIERNGSTEFVSFGFSTYGRTEKPDSWKTALNVAIDNEKESHHALQLYSQRVLKKSCGSCQIKNAGKVGIYVKKPKKSRFCE